MDLHAFDAPRRPLARRLLWLAPLAVAAGVAVALILRSGGEATPATYGLHQQALGSGPEAAAALYGRIAEAQPALADYARLWTIVAEGDALPVESVAELRALIDHRPTSPVAHLAHLALARHYVAVEDPAAEEAYRAALAVHSSAGVRLELARYLEARGDRAGAYALYRASLGDPPDAFAGMRRLGSDPVAVAEDIVDAYYLTDALETLRAETSAEARGVRARALAGLGRHGEAVEEYRAYLAVHPQDSDARLGLARSLAGSGRREEALAIYEDLGTPDALLAIAQAVEDEDPERALAIYSNHPYPLAWWLATWRLEEEGRLEEALPLYRRIANSDSYYADDAAFRLYVLGGRLNDDAARDEGRRRLEALGLNWLTLRATGRAVSPPNAPALEAGEVQALERAAALDTLGRRDLGDLEVLLAARGCHRPESLAALGRALVGRGMAEEAMALGEAWIAAHPRAPREIWALAYPRPYDDAVRAAAGEFGVDPHLIWAVMRQESRFRPTAGSGAGARGLMQLMPETQAAVAESLGMHLAPSMVYDPATNIRLGSAYLAEMLRQFGGDVEHALAAYNGGPGSAAIWRSDPAMADRDDWLRLIGYGETREYVTIVSLNYQVYRALYAEETP
jgi:soluble lytic murein transglycosylase